MILHKTKKYWTKDTIKFEQISFCDFRTCRIQQ